MVRRRKKVRNCGSEDRISSLPDDLIHSILSNMDAIDVIQTCLVSKRWRHVWRSVTQLNFNGRRFSILTKFTKFVSGFLSNRCQESHISVFNLDTSKRESKTLISRYKLNTADSRQSQCISVLRYTLRKIPHSFIKKIALHTRHAQKLNLTFKVSGSGTYARYGISGDVIGVPLFVFSCSTMKELRLISSSLIVNNFDGSSWNFQALTTLVCVGVTFKSYLNDSDGKSIDYFSNLLNLRHLTLESCRMSNSNHMNITSLRLETLTISCAQGVRGVAEVLFVVSAPNLSSFNYHDYYSGISSFISSSDGFPCLERVNIMIHAYIHTEKVIKDIIFGLIHKLSNAMSLTLSMDTVSLLSSFPELLQNQISPFCNLKLLNIVKDEHRRGSSTIPHHAITYLCSSSPSVTITNECESCFHDH